MSTMSRTGLMVPSEFDRCTTETSFVRGPSSRSNSSSCSVPLSSMGATRSCAPTCSHRSCHGTMFEWCSMWVMTISSPGPTCRRPKLCATRLMLSVELRVKTISRDARALRNRCTFTRAAS